jgi:hypothetical protein
VLDPRSIAVGGVGYGPLPMALLGVWLADDGGTVPPAPTFGGFTLLLPKYKPQRKAPRRPIEEDEALLLAVLH